MAMVISKRQLQAGDFDSWAHRFAAASEARRAAGCRGLRRLRSLDDPNQVFVVFDWDGHDNARRFIEGNQQAIRARDPDAPPPDIQTWYVEEVDALPG